MIRVRQALQRCPSIAALGVAAFVACAPPARAQDANTIRDASTFAKSIAPASASQLVNPAAVSATVWGQAANASAGVPSSVPLNLGGFSRPVTTSTAYTAAKAGGLTALGSRAMVDCASFVPSSGADPLQVQACAAVNFLANNCMTPSTVQAGVITKLGATQVVGSNCAGTYGQGVRTFNMASVVTAIDPIFGVVNNLKTTAPSTTGSVCTTANVVLTPAQYATNTCVIDSDVSAQSCSQYLNVSVITTQTPARTTESCPNGTLVGDYCKATTTGAAAVTYVCPTGETLQGNMCIGPNGSTPAIVASYTCPTGQTLSGTNCVANLSTVVGGATQDISCPTDSTWNGTACQSTVVTDATLPVGVLCLDGYGSIARDYVIDGTSCTFPSYDPAVIGCPECGGIDPPYPGVAFVVTGCPGLNDFTTYITNVRLEAQSAYRNGDCVLRASSMFYGSACPIPNPARYVLLDTTTPGRLGYMNTSTGVCSYKPAVRYSCPIGYALDANNNCVGTTTTTAIVISYFCPAGGDYVNGSCTTTVTTSATITYSCPMGQTLSGTQCTETTVTTAPATAVYSCPNGGTLSGTDCIAAGQITAAAVTYACAAGSVLSGTTCTTTTTVPATITYSCVDGSAPLNGICRIKSAQSSLTDTCGVYESSAGSMLATP